MQRDPQSHKGQNGMVAIIGGSTFMHGAPLMAALAAEASGVDLLYVALPYCHREVAKNTSLNFQVVPFVGDDLDSDDVEPILELLASMDCAVLGPGIDGSVQGHPVLNEIIASAACPLVLDAAALNTHTLQAIEGRDAVLTPHRGELERLGIAESELAFTADSHDVTICFKRSVDSIYGPEGRRAEVSGGNAGLTVGGTGDALAGLIAGLKSQQLSNLEACELASTVMKAAGDELFESKGYAYTTWDVIGLIPELIKTHT